MKKLRGEKGVGANQLLSIGIVLLGMMFSVFAIDIPMYFAAQNQLQTSVNAAALAGAAELPIGEYEAEAAALDYGMENSVLGQDMSSDNFNFNYEGVSTFEVSANVTVPTIMARLLCGMSGSGSSAEGEIGQDTEDSAGGDVGGESQGSGSHCGSMTVHANAKAVPAARDVILVVDTSQSMRGQPFSDVKEAAIAYVEQVIDLDSESVDRIGLVTFDYGSNTEIGLTSTYDSSGFEDVKDAIYNAELYDGNQGWNTNYHAGLKTALDEMESRGRKNATKTIIFLTDGYPNVPDGPDWNYKDCVNAYSSGNQYTNYANKYYRRGQTSNGDYYAAKAQEKYDYAYECTQGYTDYMISVTQEEADRANSMDVKVHTIQIGPPPSQSNSLMTIRAMLNDDDWDPDLLYYIANTTEGEQYEAATNDGPGIMAIYETIAKDVQMRLAM